jgi:hypothetical protein
MHHSGPVPSGTGRCVPHEPAASACIAGTPDHPVAAHVTMATGRGLGQISLTLTGVWPARIDGLASEATMRHGIGPGASRSAPGDAVAGC